MRPPVSALGSSVNTWRRYAQGSRPLAFAELMSEYRLALAWAPAVESLNSQLRRPTQNGRMAFSMALLSMASRLSLSRATILPSVKCAAFQLFQFGGSDMNAASPVASPCA
jgi:hypothetical protein